MPQPFDEEFVSAFVDGQLTNEELLRAEALLEENEAFRAQVNYFRELGTTLRKITPAKAPPELFDRIMHAVATQEPFGTLETSNAVTNKSRVQSRQTTGRPVRSMEESTDQISRSRETTSFSRDTAQSWKRWLLVASSLAALVLVGIYVFSPSLNTPLAENMKPPSPDSATTKTLDANADEEKNAPLRAEADARERKMPGGNKAAPRSESEFENNIVSKDVVSKDAKTAGDETPKDSLLTNSSKKSAGLTEQTEPTLPRAMNFDYTPAENSTIEMTDSPKSIRMTDSVAQKTESLERDLNDAKEMGEPKADAASPDDSEFNRPAEEKALSSTPMVAAKGNPNATPIAPVQSGKFQVGDETLELSFSESWLIEIPDTNSVSQELQSLLADNNLILTTSSEILANATDKVNETRSNTQSAGIGATALNAESQQYHFVFATIATSELDQTLKSLANFANVKPLEVFEPLGSIPAEPLNRLAKEDDLDRISAPILNRQINQNNNENSPVDSGTLEPDVNSRQVNPNGFQNPLNVVHLGRQQLQIEPIGDRLQLVNSITVQRYDQKQIASNQPDGLGGLKPKGSGGKAEAVELPDTFRVEPSSKSTNRSKISETYGNVSEVNDLLLQRRSRNQSPPNLEQANSAAGGDNSDFAPTQRAAVAENRQPESPTVNVLIVVRNSISPPNANFATPPIEANKIPETNKAPEIPSPKK